MVTADHEYEVVRGLLNCAIAHDLDRLSRSFKQFSYTSISLKISVSYFSGLWLSPGDVTKYDIADDIEWHLKVISCTSERFHHLYINYAI